MTSTNYSIAAAHRITGKSRTTIAKHIKDGKLSCTVGPDGSKQIEASELIRVYGDDLDFAAEEGGAKLESKRDDPVPASGHGDVRVLLERLEREEAERQRERDLLMDQIDHLKKALEKSMEGHNRATLLLENHTGGADDWKKRLAAIEANLSKQQAEAETKVQEARDEASTLERELEAERSKGFLQRLFG